jgi:hypothetical protein
MATYKFTPKSVPTRSLHEATAVSSGTAIPLNDCRQTEWVVEGSGTISSGTVVIESSDDPSYTGTWNQLDSITASSLTGGALYSDTVPMAGGGFVRGRITVEIGGGGNISVRINGLLN